MKKVKLIQVINCFILVVLFTVSNMGCRIESLPTWKPDLAAVEVGKIFSISLESNPSTGYSWEAEFDSELLELVETNFVPDFTEEDPDSPPLVGAPGIQIFEFRGLRQGSTEVIMSYKRVWENNLIEKRIILVRILPSTVKASKVKYVAENIEHLLGQVVVIEGEFRGWDVGNSVLGTPITRSDWGIKDETATMYVSGGAGGLRPVPTDGDIGKPITLVALVSKGEPDIYYLRALEVHVR